MVRAVSAAGSFTACGPPFRPSVVPLPQALFRRLLRPYPGSFDLKRFSCVDCPSRGRFSCREACPDCDVSQTGLPIRHPSHGFPLTRRFRQRQKLPSPAVGGVRENTPTLSARHDAAGRNARALFPNRQFRPERSLAHSELRSLRRFPLRRLWTEASLPFWTGTVPSAPLRKKQHALQFLSRLPAAAAAAKPRGGTMGGRGLVPTCRGDYLPRCLFCLFQRGRDLR